MRAIAEVVRFFSSAQAQGIASVGPKQNAKPEPPVSAPASKTAVRVEASRAITQESYDRDFSNSEKRAKRDFAWFGDLKDARFIRVQAIDVRLEANGDPIFHSADKPYILAQRAAREITEEKVAFERAVLASRGRVIAANRILADKRSLYRTKLEELERHLREDPDHKGLFTSPEWPEKLFAEFTRRYGEIPAMFR
jgi:hypothetical protein